MLQHNFESAIRSERNPIVADKISDKGQKELKQNTSVKKIENSGDRNQAKKLNFYHFEQMSPTSDVLSQYKEFQMISGF